MINWIHSSKPGMKIKIWWNGQVPVTCKHLEGEELYYYTMDWFGLRTSSMIHIGLSRVIQFTLL